MPRVRKYVQRIDGEGFAVQSGEKNRIACCDCGLIHDFVFVSDDGKPIGIAARRNNRATAQKRKHMKESVMTPEDKQRQPWPNHNWCVGCCPENCKGCGTEPLERRKPHEPVAYCVFDGDVPGFCAPMASMCHEHINEAINDYDLVEAAKWRVVPLYAAPIPADEEKRLRAQIDEAQQVLRAIQSEFKSHGAGFPDGFDSRVFRWVDDMVATMKGGK